MCHRHLWLEPRDSLLSSGSEHVNKRILGSDNKSDNMTVTLPDQLILENNMPILTARTPNIFVSVFVQMSQSIIIIVY